MSISRHLAIAPIIVLLLSCCASMPTQSQSVPLQNMFETAEGLVGAMYASVSFDANAPKPDWEKVRSMFHPNAAIAIRVSRDSTAVLSVQGFIDDFVDFIERTPAKQNGFRERVVRMKPMVFGNIAHVLVLYEAIIPVTMKNPQQGVDSWELVKLNGRWWIVAITNDVVTKDKQVPTELRE